jgi:hypothetical protein
MSDETAEQYVYQHFPTRALPRLFGAPVRAYGSRNGELRYLRFDCGCEWFKPTLPL